MFGFLYPRKETSTRKLLSLKEWIPSGAGGFRRPA
jgi:hypothetical protein